LSPLSPGTEEEDLLLRSGQQVDRYIVKDIVGRGGLAVVYRVEHSQLRSPFALKQLLITSPYIRRRLRQEGMVQANVRHPNLVLVTDMIDLPTGPGLVMEFVKGPTLEQLLAGGQQLAVEEVDRIAEGLLSGVAAAHARGLIHRDLKPGNVLLQVDEGGYVPRITDFGFVKVVTGDDDLDLSTTQPGIKLGTPRYMAPEQAMNARAVDASADVYSLGAVLYELATARKAFQHDPLDIEEMERDKGRDRYTPPREHRADMPERWERAILGALRANKKERVPSASALLELWCGESDTLPPVSPDEPDTLNLTVSTPAPERSGMRGGLIGFGFGALVLLGVVGAWRFGSEGLEGAPAPAAPVAPVAAPAPAVAPAPAPAPAVAPAPTPAPAVAPAPAPAAAKAPARAPAPARAAAEPPPPEPPVAEPPPAEEAAPADEPAPAPTMPPGHGTVRIEGNAADIFLQSGSANLLPGGVPAGTYKIVHVVSGAQAVSMGSVTVAAGEVKTIRCSSRLKRCK
jgi:serine/threonine-protein kinase